MLFSILELNLYQAFRYNPLIFILLILYIIYLILKLFFKFKLDINTKNRLSYILLFTVIIYGIIRNIPFFDYLKPTVV